MQILNFDSFDACAKCKVSPKLLAKNTLLSSVWSESFSRNAQKIYVGKLPQHFKAFTNKEGYDMLGCFSDISYIVAAESMIILWLSNINHSHMANARKGSLSLCIFAIVH